MRKIYRVVLSAEEREELRALVSKGKSAARKQTHARVLLLCDEISALTGQCLNRRIPDREFLRREVEAWQEARNRESVRVDWRFTTDDARIKLKSLYPSVQSG